MKLTAALVLLGGASSLAQSNDQQQQQQQHLSFADPGGREEPPAPAYRDALVSLHRGLVSIPSVTGQENAVGTFLVDHLTSRGYAVHLQHLPPKSNTPAGHERFNVLAWPVSSSSSFSSSSGSSSSSSSSSSYPHGPRVLVTSHIDTVPPHIPYSIDGEEEDAGSTAAAAAARALTRATRIAGRGTVDAKGSVAAQVTAVDELLASARLRAEDVLLAFVVGEENSGDGMLMFSDRLAGLNDSSGGGSNGHDGDSGERLAVRAAVFGEPTEGRLACGHKGVATLNITVHGKAAHSGYPWLGRSAIETLIRGLLALVDAASKNELGGREGKRRREEKGEEEGEGEGEEKQKYGYTTVNVGSIKGGVVANVLAYHAEAVVMFRIGADTAERELIRRVEEVLRGTDATEEGTWELTWSPGYGPVKCECDVDGFETETMNYGTDIPHFEGDHVSYLYGPGTIFVAHGDNEALTLGDLEDAVEGFKKLVLHAVSHDLRAQE